MYTTHNNNMQIVYKGYTVEPLNKGHNFFFLVGGGRGGVGASFTSRLNVLKLQERGGH